MQSPQTTVELGSAITSDDVIADLMAAVPAGKVHLTGADMAALEASTARLLHVYADAGLMELRRFCDLKLRSLAVDTAALVESHQGRTVLVTGGTGCIGSALLAELVRLQPARLISVSRGVSRPTSVLQGVEYRHVDIRDAPALSEVFEQVRPEIVYHLAAQHDPSLAEVQVARTLSTNITGSSNVFRACRRYGAKVVHASTGKALRPFSRDVYAASKKMAEWVLADEMASGELVAAAARFTHVVDNSIIAERLDGWTRTHSPVRLHSADVSFYLQSAREGAQLLLCAGLDAAPGRLRVAAIRDLGWPISLIELAVGWLAGSPHPPPLYICGFEAGYEREPYPGLYDPRSSGECSPLFNAMEAGSVEESSYCADVDFCVVQPHTPGDVRRRIDRLGRSALADQPAPVLRRAVADCGWATLPTVVGALATTVLARHVALTGPIPAARFSPDDQAVLDTVRWELFSRGESALPLAPPAPPQVPLSATPEPPVSAVPAQQSPRVVAALINALTMTSRSSISLAGFDQRAKGEPFMASPRPTTTLSVPQVFTQAARAAAPQTVDLTVLIPTFNERDNIPVLLQRLSQACTGQSVEILFVDDSRDDTPEVIRRTAGTVDVPVRLLHRAAPDRVGGLAGAVTVGLEHAHGRHVLVMDGDLQHPPELVPVLWELMDEPGVQLAVASRYNGQGRALGLDGYWRRRVSNWSTLAARGMFPHRVGRKCSDPMTGFFCVDKEALDFGGLRPQGFKILLEILVRNDLTVREVPFVFEDRLAGSSKASWQQGVLFLRQLLQLRVSRPAARQRH